MCPISEDDKKVYYKMCPLLEQEVLLAMDDVRPLIFGSKKVCPLLENDIKVLRAVSHVFRVLGKMKESSHQSQRVHPSLF